MKENPRAKIFLGVVVFVIFCVFGIGFIAGSRTGYDKGLDDGSRAGRELLNEKMGEIADLDTRLELALNRLQGYIERGPWKAIASWYGEESGTHTASGRVFDPGEFIAANWRLPFGTVLLVENITDPESSSYGRWCFVRVEDRGPAHWTKRTLDLSRAAAEHLGFIEDGLAVVRVWRLI